MATFSVYAHLTPTTHPELICETVKLEDRIKFWRAAVPEAAGPHWSSFLTVPSSTPSPAVCSRPPFTA